MRLLLDIDADGYQLHRLRQRVIDVDSGKEVIVLPSAEEQAVDPRLGLLCSGRAFGGLLAMLSTQISEATGQDVTLTAEEVRR